jgi:hypothetical protein
MFAISKRRKAKTMNHVPHVQKNPANGQAQATSQPLHLQHYLETVVDQLHSHERELGKRGLSYLGHILRFAAEEVASVSASMAAGTKHSLPSTSAVMDA